MKPKVDNWHGVALAKLTGVMGPGVGAHLAASVLEEIGLESLTSASELRIFANALSARGGFASAVAALLLLHAAMYEDGERKSA